MSSNIRSNLKGPSKSINSISSNMSHLIQNVLPNHITNNKNLALYIQSFHKKLNNKTRMLIIERVYKKIKNNWISTKNIINTQVPNNNQRKQLLFATAMSNNLNSFKKRYDNRNKNKETLNNALRYLRNKQFELIEFKAQYNI